MRTTHILAAALVSLSLAACDKPADEQKKINEAQSEADKKIAKANAEADKKTDEAQATADKKIAELKADFEKARDDYRKKKNEDLADLDKKVIDLETKSKNATGATKADVDANLKKIREQRALLASDLKGIETATSETWNDLTKKLDQEVKSLETLVDKA